MKISYNWLREYLNFNMNPNDLGDCLTSTGLEVEGVTELFAAFDHLVIGKVLECRAHPNADKLKITQVDVGGQIKQIICGANNIAQDQLVVVVLAGNELRNQKGESVKIKKTKIRGEVSEGMICSENEIGLCGGQDGIMELDIDCRVGSLLSHWLDVKKDYCLDIGLTPNRTDAFGHIGVARDLYAYFSHRKKNIKLNLPDISDYTASNSKLEVQLNVENSTLCPKYLGVSISNVTVKESPLWLQLKLISIGLKPINNIVDVTNFVLHETGNPLHAFDFDKILDKKILVRNAKINERFKTLDGKTINLETSDLVISDSEKALCLAGVIGGLNSGVDSSTKNIFLESAYFDSVSVRKTSKKHAIMSDSSYRFERGVDYSNCDYALKRAALLIRDIAGGVICNEVSFSTSELEPRVVSFSFDFCEKVLGHKIDKIVIVSILKSLGFKFLKQDEDLCDLEVPVCRFDVYRPIDIVEEILRIFGYNNLPASKSTSFNIPSMSHSFDNTINKQISHLLVSDGFFEVKNNSLIPESVFKIFGINSAVSPVKILNPLSQDLSIMRPNMLYGGLQTIRYNLNRQINDVKIFEFGKVYHRCENQYVETKRVSIFSCGVFKGDNWNETPMQTNFFFLKGLLDKIFTRFRINASVKFQPIDLDYSDYTLSYFCQNSAVSGGKNIDSIAEVGAFSSDLLKKMGIKKPVFYADLNLDLLSSIINKRFAVYHPVPKFPSVTRDLALLVNQKVNYVDIENSIKAYNTSFLKQISLFDVYEGDKIPKNQKSYAISFVFQHSERTLVDDEVDKELLEIYNALVKDFQLSLRDGELPHK